MSDEPFKGAVVYLTKASKSAYHDDSLALLQQSVRMLYANYNAAARDDVIFFHTGDIGVAEQRSVLSLCHEGARFVQLAPHHFKLPSNINSTSRCASHLCARACVSRVSHALTTVSRVTSHLLPTGRKGAQAGAN
jgi:hypothetical protein